MDYVGTGTRPHQLGHQANQTIGDDDTQQFRSPKRHSVEAHITALRAMSFSTVAGPNLGQRPTFDPESSLLWELSVLKVAQGGRRPHRCTKRHSPYGTYA
jgi:hypothetical protein